ncbi:hypothetical protein [Chitinophaga sp. CF418]|uniref:hypothetical protein n=1 Tax=Chitinophaga sp. CF418 TaxID=1855287 RepID=UPI0009216B45|nr:hypothetical protein [Chitinophaga sp. CF418]SHN34136.1 hypothetical protein SAMN05216311_109247 [Chitinophaga sp. CF418]
MRSMLPILCIFFALSAAAQTVNPALKTRPVITKVQSNSSTRDGDAMSMTAEAKIKSLEEDVQLLKTQVQDLQASLQKQIKDSKDALQLAVQLAKGQTIALDNKLNTKLDTKLGSSDFYQNTYTIDIAKETTENQGIYDYAINDGVFTSNLKAIVVANLADNTGNYAVPVKAYFGGDNKWHVTIAKYFISDVFGASLKQCATCADYPGMFPVAGVTTVGKGGTLKLNVRVINVK